MRFLKSGKDTNMSNMIRSDLQLHPFFFEKE